MMQLALLCIQKMNNQLFFSFSFFVASESSSSDKPRYMRIFSKHQHWEGNYLYNSSMYYCYLYAHSEHYLKKDVLLVTFRDKKGVTIELEGEGIRCPYRYLIKFLKDTNREKKHRTSKSCVLCERLS